MALLGHAAAHMPQPWHRPMSPSALPSFPMLGAWKGQVLTQVRHEEQRSWSTSAMLPPTMERERSSEAIREAAAREPFDRVVLAQISMSLFKLTYPEPERVFGVPVLTSGEEGFRQIRRLLSSRE